MALRFGLSKNKRQTQFRSPQLPTTSTAAADGLSKTATSLPATPIVQTTAVDFETTFRRFGNDIAKATSSSQRSIPSVPPEEDEIENEDDDLFLIPTPRSHGLPNKEVSRDISVIRSSGISEVYQQPVALHDFQIPSLEEHGAPTMSSTPIPRFLCPEPEIKRPRLSTSIIGVPATPPPNRNADPNNLLSDIKTFPEICQECGLCLKSNSRNELRVDQAIFQKRLAKRINHGFNVELNLKDFMEDAQNAFTDKTVFQNAMLPTVTAAGCPARNAEQDSLVRLLLHVNQFQSRFIDYLLNRFVQLVVDPGFTRRDVDLPRIILAQLSCLNEVQEPKLLVQKILDVLRCVPTWAQCDIITALPGIVLDEGRLETVFALSEMLGTKPELFASLLDAMENLEIPPMEASKLRMNVLDKVSTTTLRDLSALLKFLLSDLPLDECEEIVNSLRGPLHTALIVNQKSKQPVRSGAAATVQEDSDLVMLVVDNLFALLRSKTGLNVAWMKAVKEDGENVYALDFVVLVLLHGITGKKKAVESLLRNLLRTGLLNETTLLATSEVLAPVWGKHATRIIPLANTLLQSPEPVISAFGSVLYKTLFQCCSGFGRVEVVTGLMEHVGKKENESVGSASSALGILYDLAKAQRRAMCHCGMLLVNLLELLDNVTLLQARKIMEILATLAYDENGHEDRNYAVVVQSLQVTIAKQLYQAKGQYKRFGVLGGVASLRAMASPTVSLGLSEGNRLADEDICSAENLVRLGLKKALELLETLFKTTEQFPEAYELLMDELTCAVFHGDLHPHMVEYLKDQLAERFEGFYVEDKMSENMEVTIDELKFTTQFEVEFQETAAIAINIGPLVARNAAADVSLQQQPHHFIRALFSTFRLLRFVTKATDSSLEAIDALLGAPILCPAPELLDPDRFMALETREKTIISVSLIYTINWLIELLGGFVLASDSDIRLKVSKRLKHVVELKKKLFECLKHQKTFEPPLSKFFGSGDSNMGKLWLGPTKRAPRKKSVTKSRKGKKGGKKQVQGTQLAMTLPVVTQTLGGTCGTMVQPEMEETDGIIKPELKNVNWKVLRLLFREIDLDVCALLSRSLKLKPEEEDSIKMHLGPEELHWLLEDYVAKVEHRFIAGASKKRCPFAVRKNAAEEAEFAFLDQVTFEIYVEKCCCYVPKLCRHLEVLSSHFRDLMGNDDWSMDESQVLASDYKLMLQALTRLLSWNGFRDSRNQNLLNRTLAGFVNRLDTSMPADELMMSSLDDLCRFAMEFLLSVQDYVPNFAVGTQLVVCLEVIVKLSPFQVLIRRQLVACAKKFLKHEWAGFVAGAGTNPGIEQLLKIYFAYEDDPKPTVKELATEVKEIALSRTAEASSENYSTLTKVSSSVYYRCLFWALINDVQTGANKKKLQLDTPTGSQLGPDEWLGNWRESVEVLSALVGVVQAGSRRSILAVCLKYAKMFVDAFTKCAMPGLDQLLRTKTEACTQLVKALQTSTRFLHRICNDTKLKSDALTVTQVPGVKRSLEIFVYRVQAMYARNQCASACLIANLRNKDLTGKEILSQRSRQSQDSEESEDDEQVLPEDDESDVALDEDELQPDKRHKAGPSQRRTRQSRPESVQSSRSGTGTNVSRSPDLLSDVDSEEERRSVSKTY